MELVDPVGLVHTEEREKKKFCYQENPWSERNKHPWNLIPKFVLATLAVIHNFSHRGSSFTEALYMQTADLKQHWLQGLIVVNASLA